MELRRVSRVVVWVLACALATTAVFIALQWERALDLCYWLRTGYDFTWMPVGVYPFGNHAMNESGQVAVDVDAGWPATQAAIWSVEEAQVNLLGTLPECDPLSHASAINGRGSVVGGINGPAQFNVHAFVWRPGSGIIEIPGLDVGSRFAAAINDQDQVVGTAPIDGRLGAFTWDPRSGTRPLEVLPGSQETYAVDINDQGWIAGNAKTSSGETHPLLWKPGAPVRDLGLTSGYTTGYASHLNERAQVLVTFERPTGPRSKTLEAPYVWSESEGFVAVPLPQGFQDVRAMALNDLGHVLLSGRRIGTGEDAGFLVVNGQLKPLPPSRLGASTRYNGFNNKGWLTGFVEPQEGGLDTRARRGFVARP